MINDVFHVVLGTAMRDNLSGIAHYNRIVRDIEVNVCTRCDHHVVANLDSADHDRVGTDPDAVANLRHALSAPAIALSNHHSRREVDVATQPARGMNRQVSKVADIESRSNLAFDRNLEPVPVTVVIEKKTIKQRACNAQPAWPVPSRLAFAQKVAEPESRNFTESLPERGSVIAPIVAPKIRPDRRFEVYRQGIPRELMVPGIISCTTARLEATNPVDETFLQPPAELPNSSGGNSRRAASSGALAKP